MSGKFEIVYKNNNEIYKLLLTPQECINLEVKLNLSEYGVQWIEIGDDLYNFSVQKKNCKNRIFVNKFQINYLKGLYNQK